MTDKFLQAKHWQIFLLTYGIPLIFQIIMMSTMVSNFTIQNNIDFKMMSIYMKYFSVVMVIFILVFFGWFWSVANGLQSKLPENIEMKIKRFKIFLFIPLIYIVLILIFSGIFLNGILKPNPELNLELLIGFAAFLLPLHLFSIFCIFYSMYFVAKTIKTAELQQEVEFSDFVGEFFLVWFFPIGIWILQPKINKLVEG